MSHMEAREEVADGEIKFTPTAYTRYATSVMNNELQYCVLPYKNILSEHRGNWMLPWVLFAHCQESMICCLQKLDWMMSVLHTAAYKVCRKSTFYGLKKDPPSSLSWNVSKTKGLSFQFSLLEWGKWRWGLSWSLSCFFFKKKAAVSSIVL